jgi:hypothetical protein
VACDAAGRLSEEWPGVSDLEQARRPPAPTAKHTEPRSAAGAVGAADRTRVGDRAHPLGRRTTRQNDGHRHPAAAHIGTSGVFACGKHAWGGAAWATPRTIVRGHSPCGAWLAQSPSGPCQLRSVPLALFGQLVSRYAWRRQMGNSLVKCRGRSIQSAGWQKGSAG